MTPVRHPEDGRWGVLVPTEVERPEAPIIGGGWLTKDRWVLNRPWCKPDEGCRLCDYLRANEFSLDAPIEAIRMPGGYGFFHIVAPR